ncbi:MAG: hypothetical protein U1F81_04555 [Verrucomicrobiaceae bacterium]
MQALTTCIDYGNFKSAIASSPKQRSNWPATTTWHRRAKRICKVWSLFNAFTESLKDGNLAELPKRTEALHGLLDTHVGLSA